MIIGIDPGWASFGMSAVDPKGSLRVRDSMVPRDFVTPYKAIQEMWVKLNNISSPGAEPLIPLIITDVYIERYVSYGGVTTDPEKILMMIGALEYFFEAKGINVHMVRAIDWKPKVCKYLVRTKGFNNPYPSFDKKYSILAAQELSGFECKSDHTADAICLAYLKQIDDYELTRKNKPKGS